MFFFQCLVVELGGFVETILLGIRGIVFCFFENVGTWMRDRWIVFWMFGGPGRCGCVEMSFFLWEHFLVRVWSDLGIDLLQVNFVDLLKLELSLFAFFEQNFSAFCWNVIKIKYGCFDNCDSVMWKWNARFSISVRIIISIFLFPFWSKCPVSVLYLFFFFFWFPFHCSRITLNLESGIQIISILTLFYPILNLHVSLWYTSYLFYLFIIVFHFL